MSTFNDVCSELENARQVFENAWSALYSFGPDKLNEWNINTKPMLKQQKRMLHLFGSEVDLLDNQSLGNEMQKLNEVYNFYCPGGKIPQSYQCQLVKALSIQKKLNKTCNMLLQKAERKQAQENYNRLVDNQDPMDVDEPSEFVQLRKEGIETVGPTMIQKEEPMDVDLIQKEEPMDIDKALDDSENKNQELE